MIQFETRPDLDPFAVLGFIPGMLSELDPRPAREQLDSGYQHGGGWRPLSGWTREGVKIRYPGDDPLTPLSWGLLRDEAILVYESAWVMILQRDGSFEVGRMD